MCKTRTWKNIEVKLAPNGIRIIGVRSDHQMFKVDLNDGGFGLIHKNNIKEALEKFDSFRNCDCFTGRTCNKHLTF
jgi:plastocyanin domain-containing protein